MITLLQTERLENPLSNVKSVEMHWPVFLIIKSSAKIVKLCSWTVYTLFRVYVYTNERKVVKAWGNLGFHATLIEGIQILISI